MSTIRGEHSFTLRYFTPSDSNIPTVYKQKLQGHFYKLYFWICIFQISRNQNIYLRSHFFVQLFVTLFCHTFFLWFCLKRPSLICLFHFTLFLSLSLSLLILIWIKGNPCIISQNYLFLFPKIPHLLHLMHIYGRFRPCFLLYEDKKWNIHP